MGVGKGEKETKKRIKTRAVLKQADPSNAVFPVSLPVVK
jgi:hypothetical protein